MAEKPAARVVDPKQDSKKAGAASTRASVSLPFLNASIFPAAFGRGAFFSWLIFCFFCIDALSLFEGWKSLITFHRTLALDRHFIRISHPGHFQSVKHLDRNTFFRMQILDQPTHPGPRPSTLVAHRTVLTAQGQSGEFAIQAGIAPKCMGSLA
ncbi:hypothetical protein PAPYR_12611 [Paratrimastix pyriformis]|uniref:Uncharacterized protein n=1 Tax=Paratrimastix pyriformis TaxID=342808 RepID=A0ABQ8U370_9EUKA|nr:hypothetical protein PAPYR_12611 [Paratrimastix pyriformis]